VSDAVTRRRLLAGAAGVAAASVGALGVQRGRALLAQPEARVVTLAAATYGADLSRRLQEGIATFPATVARARGGVVVLKPNLVEVHPGRPINTDPRLIAAAVEAFHRLGAAEVIVAEGPGHHRDTDGLLEWSGLDALLRETRARFVDLNVADTGRVRLRDDFSGLGHLELPRLVTGADLLVSLPKLKTHHWVGATLSMKNLFGVVPGSVYGWPKNPLHHAGIHECIIDLWRSVAPGFAIVDGVVGMEGDGPIMGTAVNAGVVVLGEQLPAVDAVSARLMGLDTDRLGTLQVAAKLGGTVHPWRIAVDGDAVAPTPFALLDRWAHLRA
jgi:uncharacterized protein (DUF362 family)